MTDRAKKEKQFWDRFARCYGLFVACGLGSTYKQLLEQLKQDVEPSDRVLDVATGTGTLAFEICGDVKSIAAVDLSEEMISIAQEKLRKSAQTNITFLVEDAYSLTFSDNTFDMVIASNVLHLLYEPERVLAEMKRVVRPSGRLVLPTFCHGESRKSRFISSLMSLVGCKAVNKWSIRELQMLIISVGCTIDREVTINDKIPLSYLVASAQRQLS